VGTSPASDRPTEKRFGKPAKGVKRKKHLHRTSMDIHIRNNKKRGERRLRSCGCGKGGQGGKSFGKIA